MSTCRLSIHTKTKLYAYARASLRLRPAIFVYHCLTDRGMIPCCAAGGRMIQRAAWEGMCILDMMYWGKERAGSSGRLTMNLCRYWR